MGRNIFRRPSPSVLELSGSIRQIAGPQFSGSFHNVICCSEFHFICIDG